MWTALRSLPAAQAEVVVLKTWEGMTFAQIAEVLIFASEVTNLAGNCQSLFVVLYGFALFAQVGKGNAKIAKNITFTCTAF